MYTLNKIQKFSCVDEIVLVCADGWDEYMTEMAEKHGVSKLRKIVRGGDSRHASVTNGIEYIKSVAKPDDIICIHEACRPLITEEVFTKNIEAARKHGAAIAVDACYDSMYVHDGSSVVEKALDRSMILKGQSPEAATLENVAYVYDRANREGTNDVPLTALLLRYGVKIVATQGSVLNFKITTEDDIDLFQAYLLLQNQK